MSYRFTLMLALAIVICTLWSPTPADSQTMSTNNTPPTACVAKIVKTFLPNQTSPNSVFIAKTLTGFKVCSLVANNFASCIPATTVNTMSLFATAVGAQVTMSPSCSWSCAGCGTIAISSVQDGLPVELMDFSIE